MSSTGPHTLVISGYSSCPYFQNAVTQARRAHEKHPERYKEPIINMFGTRSEYQNWLDTDASRPRNDARSKAHRTCPFVYEQDTNRFVGGHDDMVAELSKA